MDPSTAAAVVIVDELIRCGVTDFVLCPGSRNAPLAFALLDADRAGRARLHVRIDERSAGFLALGLSKGLALHGPRRGYAAVTCTSGTAVANLHPAALEAAHTGEPLVLLTADRPTELVGTGASQTTRQRGIFEPEVSTVDFPTPERRAGQNAIWRGIVSRAIGTAAGPVHLNVPLRDPLVPRPGDWVEPLAGRPNGQPWTRVSPTVPGPPQPQELPARTLVVAGHGSTLRDPVEWPVVAEPGGPAGALQHGSLLLAAGLPQRLAPEAVVVFGRPTLSRGVQRLLRETSRVHIVADPATYADPQYVAASVSATARLVGGVDPEWLAAWEAADKHAGEAIDALLAAEPWPTGLHVARTVLAGIPSDAVLFLGSSNVVRDVDLVAGQRGDVAVVASRGLAGIDGNTSTAAGLALATGRPGYALLGDLTFLHDIGGLLVGPTEIGPDLTVVVLNDDGGGIFTLLEQGGPDYAGQFERIFGTPHGADLAALCAGYGVSHTLAGSDGELRDALRPHKGMRVVEVRTDRSRLRDLHARLRAAVARATSHA